MTPFIDDPLKPPAAPDGAGVDPLPAAMLTGVVGVMSTPLRADGQSSPLPLMYHFTAEYRAWVEVIQVHERSRSPMVLARIVLCRALVELYGSDRRQQAFKWAETEAARAARRRRAWMTVNGQRYIGVGADAEQYRSVAIRVSDCLIIAVVPTGQERIEVRLSAAYTDREQRQAIHGAGPNRKAR